MSNAHTVAEASGVGTTYRIDAYLDDMSGDMKYRVVVSSGPASELVDDALTWVAAMNLVRDGVQNEMNEEAGFEAEFERDEREAAQRRRSASVDATLASIERMLDE